MTLYRRIGVRVAQLITPHALFSIGSVRGGRRPQAFVGRGRRRWLVIDMQYAHCTQHSTTSCLLLIGRPAPAVRLAGRELILLGGGRDDCWPRPTGADGVTSSWMTDGLAAPLPAPSRAARASPLRSRRTPVPSHGRTPGVGAFIHIFSVAAGGTKTRRNVACDSWSRGTPERMF